MDIKMIYADEHMAVCLKPVGLESEEAGMVRELSRQLGGEFFCVHRLDKAVGGLMVYARDKKTAAALSADIAGGKFIKEYVAAVSGCPAEEQGILKDLLFHDKARNKSYPVSRLRRGVKEAKLEYRLLERRDDASLLRIRLHTGRSHQIRVQFASRAMPLLGDIKYGSRERRCGIALWSCRLAFNQPGTGRSMDFELMPPEEFPWNRFDCLKASQSGGA